MLSCAGPGEVSNLGCEQCHCSNYHLLVVLVVLLAQYSTLASLLREIFHNATSQPSTWGNQRGALLQCHHHLTRWPGGVASPCPHHMDAWPGGVPPQPSIGLLESYVALILYYIFMEFAEHFNNWYFSCHARTTADINWH